MSATTSPNPAAVDDFGIERTDATPGGRIARGRARWGWFDHTMRMIERYARCGGWQFGAAITYFSVMSIIPLLMLVFSAAGFVLNSQPRLIDGIEDFLSEYLGGDVAPTFMTVITAAVDQRGMVLGLGAFTALWTGTNWMVNLRFGTTAVWMADPRGSNFFTSKLRDVAELIGLMVVMLIAFGVTTVQTNAVAERIIVYLGVDHVPGMGVGMILAAFGVAVLANFIAVAWIMKAVPKFPVPWSIVWRPALVGAIILELFKRGANAIAIFFFAYPAGAVFGPAIAIMVLLFIVWQIVMLCTAWSATSDRALELMEFEAPQPAVLRMKGVRGRSGPSASGSALLFACGAVIAFGVRSVRYSKSVYHRQGESQ
ncbi:Inner membrane protein YhjD [Corynebacterium ciconiae DSM 44920]|uniref:YihY/virulence factor BrkB family protein n=1 Tax=Corynebacterium ciconiae TaxID=227319 RepID=UPI00035EEB4F|nr:YhjD/YihY/BrkB family envelope integrity protein [Corynebacterium ciconiae]WKD61857.1 Inner membrane protein YhjD [Corynebacterium ciconiae DSM 44920]